MSRICAPDMSWEDIVHHQNETGHDDCISLPSSLVCAQCLKYSVAQCETDEDDVFWTYCRPCDFWTEHGKEQT